jgi:hypothetical protein
MELFDGDQDPDPESVTCPAMGARNQVGIGLPDRPASLCSLAIQFQTRPIAGIKFSNQDPWLRVGQWDLRSYHEKGTNILWQDEH